MTTINPNYNDEELTNYIEKLNSLNNEILPSEDIKRIDEITYQVIKLDRPLTLLETKLLSLYAVYTMCRIYKVEQCPVEFEKMEPYTKCGAYQNGTIYLNYYENNGIMYSRPLFITYPSYGGISNDALHVIFFTLHEFEHHFQIHDKESQDKFHLIIELLYEKDYIDNYEGAMIEKLANCYGWINTSTFISIILRKVGLKEEYTENELLMQACNNANLARANISTAHRTKSKNPTAYDEVKIFLYEVAQSKEILPRHWLEIYPTYLIDNFIDKINGTLMPTQLIIDKYNDLYHSNLPAEEKIKKLALFELFLNYALLSRPNEKTTNNQLILRMLILREIDELCLLGKSYVDDDVLHMIPQRLNHLLSLIKIYENCNGLLSDDHENEMIIAKLIKLHKLLEPIYKSNIKLIKLHNLIEPNNILTDNISPLYEQLGATLSTYNLDADYIDYILSENDVIKK